MLAMGRKARGGQIAPPPYYLEIGKSPGLQIWIICNRPSYQEMIVTFNDSIQGLKWTHMDPHGSKFSLQYKKPYFWAQDIVFKGARKPFLIFNI